MNPSSVPFHLPRALSHLSHRLLTLDDAPAVLQLRRETLVGMPAALRAVDPERGCLPDVENAYAQTHLGPRAITLGVFHGSSLVAFACLLLADRDDAADPGHAVGLLPGDWSRSAHMAACMVSEHFWGLHLQVRLLHWRREMAIAHDRTLLLAMTACGNTFSRRNLLAAGLSIHWLGQWRPGSWWYGLRQDLLKPLESESGVNHEWVGVGSLDRQLELLRSGHVGVAEMTWHRLERRQESRLQFVRKPSPSLKLGGPSSNVRPADGDKS